MGFLIKGEVFGGNKIMVSIIIPVYNGELYIRRCMDSAINQTYEEIEIICVDDASTDDTLDVLKEYANKDFRVHILEESNNVGTSKSRKDGVKMSKGEHVLFLDADDELDLCACERLLTVYKEHNKDIIQFGIEIIAAKTVNKQKIQSVCKYVEPLLGEIDIVQERQLCFAEQENAHNLCGKFMDGNVVRQAFSFISDDRLLMAEDLYAFYTISLLANGYFGIDDKLYKYYYGNGITGNTKTFAELLEFYSSQARIYRNCCAVSKKMNMKKECESLLAGINRNMKESCISFVCASDDTTEKEQVTLAENILKEYWSEEDIWYMLARLLQDRIRMRNRMAETIYKKHWLFPYDKVNKDTEIILYGAGDVGIDYYRQIKYTDYCKVILWVDKGKCGSTIEGSIISSLENIELKKNVMILIAVEDEKLRRAIKKDLENHGVRENLIL